MNKESSVSEAEVETLTSKQKWIFLGSVCFASVFGFLLGQIDITEPGPPVVDDDYQEIVVVHFQELIGDELQFEISGPARVVWEGLQVIEEEGVHTIPVSQIPTENDLALRDFPFTGNMKTKKFYESDSYNAGCIAPEKRKFFTTKEEGITAGYKPPK